MTLSYCPATSSTSLYLSREARLSSELLRESACESGPSGRAFTRGSGFAKDRVSSVIGRRGGLVISGRESLLVGGT